MSFIGANNTTPISTARISKLRLVGDGVHLLLRPAHLTTLLERLSKMGDRVQVKGIGGIKRADTHFFFNPDDIDTVFRKGHSKLGLSKRQTNMLHEPNAPFKPTIINSEGTEWADGRRTLARHIHPKNGLPTEKLNIVSDEIKKLINDWKSKNTINLAQESSNLSIKIAYKVLFNQEASLQTCRELETAARQINRHQFTVAITTGFLKSISGNLWGLAGATEKFNSEIEAVRKKYFTQDQHSRTPILLDDLNDPNNKELSDARIAMMLRASHATMNYTLFNAIWFLSAREDLQERIASNEKNSELLGQVVKETLRLSPPICVLPKETREEIQLSKNYVIAKGDTVVLSPYITNRDSRLYEDPLSFNPEKHFNQDAQKNRHRDSFTAYGVGPRKCPGRTMAEQEIKLALHSICQNFNFTRNGSSSTRPSANIIMLPNKNAMISLEKR